MSCSTCHGAPIRAVRRGHDVVFRACARAEAETSCPDCGDSWELPLVCDCCEGPLPESPASLRGDLLCDACLVAIADPAVVERLLAVTQPEARP